MLTGRKLVTEYLSSVCLSKGKNAWNFNIIWKHSFVETIIKTLTITIISKVTYGLYAAPEVKTLIIINKVTYGLHTAPDVETLKFS